MTADRAFMADPGRTAARKRRPVAKRRWGASIIKAEDYSVLHRWFDGSQTRKETQQRRRELHATKGWRDYRVSA